MTQHILVLGGGRVGSAIARDLAAESRFRVTVADRSPAALGALADRGIATREADLSDPAAIGALVRDADLVVGAVPGAMGFATVRAVLEAERPVVDISFFPEDPFDLDALARSRGLVAAVDCGIAPGCSNLVLGHHEATMEAVERFDCWVGGLPVVRSHPWEYRAVFSPLDVLEEYLRPARFVERGEPRTVPALSELDRFDLPGVGTVESFLTDGLRTLLRTSRVPNLREKTLRYPGHAERIHLLRESGFLGSEPIAVGGVEVRPIELAGKLLTDSWLLPPGEEDLTVMRMIVEGTREGTRTRVTYDLLDRFDRASGTTSMARTTGYTCTGVVRLVADGLWKEPGIAPPELIGQRPECFRAVFDHLAERGVSFRVTEAAI